MILSLDEAIGEVPLGRFSEEAATDSGIYGHHLRDHWLTLQGHPD